MAMLAVFYCTCAETAVYELPENLISETWETGFRFLDLDYYFGDFNTSQLTFPRISRKSVITEQHTGTNFIICFSTQHCSISSASGGFAPLIPDSIAPRSNFLHPLNFTSSDARDNQSSPTVLSASTDSDCDYSRRMSIIIIHIIINRSHEVLHHHLHQQHHHHHHHHVIIIRIMSTASAAATTELYDMLLTVSGTRIFNISIRCLSTISLHTIFNPQ